MTHALCMLFEGSYHLGLAVLINSAYANGWRGTLYAGYRGTLPPWAKSAKASPLGHCYEVGQDSKIEFIKLNTTVHLTNYKPDFMLDIWTRACPESDALFYFDPDIVLQCEWSFFEEWASYGVALVEDVNSPLAFNHPRRAAWKKYYRAFGFELKDVTEFYVNGGFIGVLRKDIQFLYSWKKAQDLMAEDMGGLDNSNLGTAPTLETNKRSSVYMFNKTDQDALNVAVMESGCPVSIMGSDAMDFKLGGYLMSHSAGLRKPWNKNPFRETLLGNRPSNTDKLFWKHTQHPIPAFTKSQTQLNSAIVRFCAAAGRFYHRG